ncbi:type I methionyl aminopeptidase [Candidatus Uhrbacteria bacterium CG_4_9_14_3_um_filter_50_9]|uniref:Methionine aminopeptidase n=1 Tax=Candidatus Uhrbacteria bacterium CG_4_9_14_3_um_filter_50_9 TaxID=1975035 RepID=A0A2M7XCQ8_9BACT|nr:MAG: type I methionyl aminopeptidase [Candidatus Uhrbacteria bacterium CG_4_9_14_3_um_filter_50_9]
MALTKTPQEIEKMRRGGALLSKALGAAVALVKPGVSIKELNDLAEKVIREGGGEPSFLGYKGSPDDTPFPSTVCISVNEEVVHGLGNRERKLKEGDIVGLDIGLWLEGLCTDMAVTVPVGNVSEEATKLMRVTREALMKGVEAAHVGGMIRDIAQATEEYVKPHGYGIVRALVGHGVGHKVHEAPHVPNYVSEHYPAVQIQEGMCLALEPMLGLGGDYRVDTAQDGWSIVMRDGSLGAHFEVTIAVTKDGTEILTPLPV